MAKKSMKNSNKKAVKKTQKAEVVSRFVSEEDFPKRVEHEYSIRRATEFSDGGIVFDLQVDDITIYGCRVVDYDGGQFVSFPQRKGKENNWYSQVYFKLTRDEQEEILELVGYCLFVADDEE